MGRTDTGMYRDAPHLKTDIEEDDDDAITIAEHIEDLADDFHTHGADCFQHCSKGKIETISGAVEAMINPEAVEILKKFKRLK